MSSPEQARLVFHGTVDEQGHVVPEQRNVVKGRLVRNWKGQRVTVVVSRWRKTKTDKQLAYYFAEIVPAWAEWTGYDEDEMHVELKRAWLAPRLAISRLTGEEGTERPTLSDLSCVEMSEYIDRCIREGNHNQITFKTPEQYYAEMGWKHESAA